MALTRWVGRAIGLDVHRDFCVVAICEDGEVRSGGSGAEHAGGLGAAGAEPGGVGSGGVGGDGQLRGRSRGSSSRTCDRVVVVSPDDTGIAQARAKTDRLDARTLARLLWAGELEAVWMPDERCRVMRRRLARREQLVRSRSRAKNEIHAVLHAPAAGQAAVLGPVRGQGPQVAARARAAGRGGRDGRQPAMRHIEFLDAEIAAVERLIARRR